MSFLLRRFERARATCVAVGVATLAFGGNARAQNVPGDNNAPKQPATSVTPGPVQKPAPQPVPDDPSAPRPPSASTTTAPPPPAPQPLPAETKRPLLINSDVKPPPLHIDYAEYGVAITGELGFSSPATCPTAATGSLKPCILGSGGGLAIRGGYRTAGPWYYGGAYEFSKMDSSNLYRLGILQQLRAEMRYHLDLGTRAEPFAMWGVGALVYGNEWGVETAGALAFIGAGVHVEVSRLAVVGMGIAWKPALIAGWTDTANVPRSTGLANFITFDVELELRSELGRR